MIRFAVAMILLALAGSTWASQLIVKLDRQEVALGQMVTLSIEAVDMKGTLENLDTHNLAADFEIYNTSSSRYGETRGKRSITHQQLELSLFPMHTGKITVPSFFFGGKKSRPVILEVADSSTTVPHVLIRSGVVAPQLYQREESIMYVDAYQDGSLQWREPPKVAGAGFYLRPLPDSMRKETVDGVVYTVKRFAWGVTPLGFGTLAVSFSNIEAGKFGERLRYRVPTIARDIKPVPAYLPIFLHVGELSLTSSPLSSPLETGRPSQWTMELRGKGLSVDGLRKFLVLPDDQAMSFYVPDIAVAGAPEDGPGMQVARISIPFKPLESGEARLPEVRIPYYDPEHNKLGAAILPSRNITIINPIWEYAKKAIFTVAIIVIGFFLVKRALPYYRGWTDRRRWIRSLELATDPRAFYGILRKGAGCFYIEGEEISKQLLKKLDQACFGQQEPADFNGLKSELLAWLRKGSTQAQPESSYHKNVSEIFNPPNP